VPERRLGARRAWERTELLEPRIVGREPEFVSDGGGLQFQPSALAGAAAALDPADPAVAALLGRLRGERPALRLPWKRRAPATGSVTARESAAGADAAATLSGWRLLARTDDEALFGRGHPSKLLTVAVKRHPRRGEWEILGVTRERPLRAARDGIRASSWRIEPDDQPDPGATELRILVTEQQRAAGRYADGRFLEPALYLAEQELILTLFVSPVTVMGVQGPNPETPVRIALPVPVGERALIDGALYEPQDPRAAGESE